MSNNEILIKFGDYNALQAQQLLIGNIIHGNITIQNDDPYDVRELSTYNPYLGLQTYTYLAKDLYAGRDEELARALYLLTTPGQIQNVMFVTGISGSGKSSFVQAGVLPKLQEYYFGDRTIQKFQRWLIRPAQDPIAQVVDALNRYGLASNDHSVEGLHAAFQKTPADHVNVLIIDQFEEIFTLTKNPEKRKQFIDFLANMPDFSTTRTLVLLTIRIDYIGNILEVSKTLYQTAIDYQIALGPMDSNALREAILQPLRWLQKYQPQTARKAFEPALLNRLIKDAINFRFQFEEDEENTTGNNDAAYLPLLQVTLAHLWNKGSLRAEEYDTLTTALNETANAVLTTTRNVQGNRIFRSAEEQAKLLDLLIKLVDFSLDNNPRRDVRIRRYYNELATTPEQKKHIEELTQARLLSIGTEDHNNYSRIVVDLIHETLLHSWQIFARFIKTKRTEEQQRTRFRDGFNQWNKNEKHSRYLLSGVRLAEAQALLEQNNVETRDKERKHFITQSIAARDKRRRRLLMLTSILMVVFAGLAILAWNRQQVAVRNQQDLERQLAIMDSQRIAGIAQEHMRENTELGLLLTYEALSKDDNYVTNTTLRKALGNAQWQTNIFEDHSNSILSAIFAPNGQSILTASSDHTASLWKTDGTLITTFVGHFGAVTSAVFSPDGQTVLTASIDGTARLWDLEGNLLVPFSGHFDSVISAIFSPDGQAILTVSADGTARLWDLDGTLLTIFFEPDTDIIKAIFSPDGNTILTASQYRAARLWNLEGKTIKTFHSDTGAVNNVVFSPDGKYIFTASVTGPAYLWGTDGHLVATFIGHRAPITSVVFSSDGQTILTASEDHTARLWFRDGTVLTTFEGNIGAIRSAIFSPDEQTILTISRDHTARLWQRNGTLIITLVGHDDEITSAAFSPDGNTILTASEDYTARLWKPDSSTIVTTFVGHTSTVESITFSSDGQTILTASQDGTVRLWNLDGTLLTTLVGHFGIQAAIFDPNGKTILTATQDDTVRLWNLDGTLLTTLVGHDYYVTSAAFSSDGQTILTGSLDNTARLWNFDGTLLTTFIGHDDDVVSATFSSDGQTILTASRDNTARLWNLDGTLLTTFIGHDDDVTSATFSSDGQTILTGSLDGAARLWKADGTLITTIERPNDVSDREELDWFTKYIITPSLHDNDGMNAVLSSDGQYILTASWDRTARLWQRDGTLIKILVGYNVGFMNDITSTMFSPNEQYILTISDNGTAHVWNLNGTLFTTITTHDRSISSATFSPDGRYILTAYEDGTIHLTLINTEDLLKVAACRVGRDLTEEEQIRFNIPEPAFVFEERECPPKIGE